MCAPTRDNDRWILPVEGQPVTQLRVDYAITLLLENGIAVRIENPFVLATGDERYQLDPSDEPIYLAPVLPLARARIVSGTAFDNGKLRLVFADGSEITVSSSEDYEPWEICGPQGFLMVSVPGGELAIWLPEEIETE
ncbi:MAG: DUF6188 family protein [Micrococcales bacterium]|nr:DUF6188 family protein [Micrococcales bacterium]MCL2666841.1 DUF6188 family protein [Micrococcales bacterium]